MCTNKPPLALRRNYMKHQRHKPDDFSLLFFCLTNETKPTSGAHLQIFTDTKLEPTELLLALTEWTMADSQCKHMVSKAILPFVFHPRTYIQMRGSECVRNIVLSRAEERTGMDSNPSTTGTNYWLLSQEKWSHTATNSTRQIRALAPQPLVSL